MSLCVSSRLACSLHFLQRLSLLALLMVYSSVIVSLIFNPYWSSFPVSSLFIFYIALMLVDILLILSASFWLIPI